MKRAKMQISKGVRLAKKFANTKWMVTIETDVKFVQRGNLDWQSISGKKFTVSFDSLDEVIAHLQKLSKETVEVEATDQSEKERLNGSKR